jgi:hypothetical protein
MDFSFDAYEDPAAVTKKPLKKPLKSTAAPRAAATSAVAEQRPAEPANPGAVPVAAAAPGGRDDASYDDLFSDDISSAAAAPQHSQRHRSGAASDVSKFAASMTAAAAQRQQDRDDAIVDRQRAEREGEAGDVELAKLDKDVGVYVTRDYRARMNRREALEEEDETLQFRAPTRRTPAAAAVAGKVIEVGTDVLGTFDGENSFADSDAVAGMNSRTVADDVAEPVTTPAATVTAGRDTSSAGTAEEYELAMAELASARRTRRHQRAKTRLSDESVQRMRMTYLRIRAAVDEQLLRELGS